MTVVSRSPSFLSFCSVTFCHHPRLSRASGVKNIPFLLHSSPSSVIFLAKASLAAWPWTEAALATVAACRGRVTVMFQAVYLPPNHQGNVTTSQVPIPQVCLYLYTNSVTKTMSMFWPYLFGASVFWMPSKRQHDFAADPPD